MKKIIICILLALISSNINLAKAKNNATRLESNNKVAIDNTPPSVPTGLRIVSLDHYRVKIAWNASTDDSGSVKGYPIWTSQTVWGGSDKYSTTNSYTIYFDNAWYALEGGYFRFALQAEDYDGNKSALSSHIVINIPNGVPRITVTPLNPLCADQQLGSVRVKIPSFAQSNYKLILDNTTVSPQLTGGQGYTFNGIAIGNHKIEIRYAVEFGPIGPTRLEDTYYFSIAVPPLPLVLNTDVTSNSVQLNVTGGVPPYFYKRTDGFYNSNSLFTNLNPDTNYSFTVRDSNGCTIGRTIRTLPSGKISLTRNQVQNDFDSKDLILYPNPMDNELLLTHSFIIDEITIFSNSGEIVLQKSINDYKSTIDVSHLPKGNYFAEVKTNGKIEKIQLIKK